MIKIFKMLIFSISLLVFANALLISQIKIKAVGDVMLGSYTPKSIIPKDSGSVFYHTVGNMLKFSDITFGNFEGNFIEDGWKPRKCSQEARDSGKCYEFGMPEYLSNIPEKLGFNVMNLDNNHSSDFGEKGYNFTVEILKKHSINPLLKRTPLIINIKKQEIAFVAFAFNVDSYPLSNLARVKEIISELRSKYNLVIVSFHGGKEGEKAAEIYDESENFLGDDRGNVIQFAHAAIDAGASLVLGHGPHVLRAMEIYKNKLIAYSLGNFLTYGNFNLSGICKLSCILDIEIDEKNGNFLKGRIIPIKQAKRGIPYFDSKKESVKLLQKLIKKYNKCNLILDDDGIIKAQN
jgi:hypothetical protein